MLNLKFVVVTIFLSIFIIGCKKKENTNIVKPFNESKRIIKKLNNDYGSKKISNNNVIQESYNISKNSLLSNQADINLITDQSTNFSSNILADNLNDELSQLSTIRITDDDAAQEITFKLINKLSEKELFDFALKCDRNHNELLEYILLSNLFTRIENQTLKENCLFRLMLSSSDIKRYKENINWSKKVLKKYPEDSWLYTPAVLKMADSSEKIGDYKNAIHYYNKELQRMYLPSTALPLAEVYSKNREKDKAINVINKAIRVGNPSPFENHLLLQLSNKITRASP